MIPTNELEQKIRSGKDPSVLDSGDLSAPELSDYLRSVLEEHDMTVIQAIQCCNLDRSYGYQMFNGTRRPTRDVLLTLAIQLGLSEEETQRLLKLAGRPVLYARNRRDAAVLYCLSHRLSPAEAEDLISGSGVDPLGTRD